LWIGSRRRGLLRVDDPSKADPVFSAYTRSSGLSSMTVAALAEDLDGRIYVASGSGIDRLDPPTGRIRTFTPADGVLPAEARVGFRDRHGALWFGGDHGLIRVEQQKEPKNPPIVLVHSIRVNGEVRPISDLGDVEPAELSLSPSERQVQVDFGGFRPDLSYQTRLSGVDREWTPPSSSRSVHYLSLAPGSYELAIRAVTPEGSSSSSPAKVRFRIAPPLWQRRWFLALAAVCVCALAFVVHRSRVRHAIAVERVRSQIAADLHDGVGASLSRIAILSEVVRQQADSALPDAIPALTAISDNARAVIDDMSDAVWFIDPQVDSLQQVVIRARAMASELFDGQRIRWTVEAPDEASQVPLAAEQRRHVYLILKEALTNVLRHAQATSVGVLVTASRGRLRIEVTDDGIGLDGKARNGSPGTNGGHGLENIRRRTSALGGTARIDSPGHGRGTSIVVEAPVMPSHVHAVGQIGSRR
jgi:signal transduction histidine kinase